MASRLCFKGGSEDDCPLCQRTKRVERLVKESTAEPDTAKAMNILDRVWSEIDSPIIVDGKISL
jgi:hypothetical protein